MKRKNTLINIFSFLYFSAVHALFKEEFTIKKEKKKMTVLGPYKG